MWGCGATKPRGAHVIAFKVGGLQHVAVVPAGAPDPGKRAMVVFLYGRGGHASDQLSNQVFFDALARAGSHAPVFVFAQSNDHSYWHDRRERAWGKLISDKVIPAAVKRFGIDRTRIGIGGISMGGFGAYDIARLHPGAFCAVAGHSPAIFPSANEVAAGAFDDGADFTRHDLLERSVKPFARVRHLWLDAGTGDPFDRGDRAFVRRLAAARIAVRVHRYPGGHDSDYWQAHWSGYVRFYAQALADCVG